ncbi:hypothetical protein JOQ06_022928, partial [Pogonophryne albipinna]
TLTPGAKACVLDQNSPCSRTPRAPGEWVTVLSLDPYTRSQSLCLRSEHPVLQTLTPGAKACVLDQNTPCARTARAPGEWVTVLSLDPYTRSQSLCLRSEQPVLQTLTPGAKACVLDQNSPCSRTPRAPGEWVTVLSLDPYTRSQSLCLRSEQPVLQTLTPGAKACVLDQNSPCSRTPRAPGEWVTVLSLDPYTRSQSLCLRSEHPVLQTLTPGAKACVLDQNTPCSRTPRAPGEWVTVLSLDPYTRSQSLCLRPEHPVLQTLTPGAKACVLDQNSPCSRTARAPGEWVTVLSLDPYTRSQSLCLRSEQPVLQTLTPGAKACVLDQNSPCS